MRPRLFPLRCRSLTTDTFPLQMLKRRAFLGTAAAGMGGMALATLLRPAASAAAERGTGGSPPRAKRVIFLFMAGGPSHIDLFDPKPLLNRLDGTSIPAELLRNHQQFALIRGTPNLKGSPYRFRPHGESGIVISELLPHLATVADELAVIRSMHTTTNVHDPAVHFLNSGSGREIDPPWAPGCRMAWDLKTRISLAMSC